MFYFLISIIAMTFGWKRDVPKGNTKEYTQNLTNEKVGAFKGILIILGDCANALHVDGKYTFVNVGWCCVALFFPFRLWYSARI